MTMMMALMTLQASATVARPGAVPSAPAAVAAPPVARTPSVPATGATAAPPPAARPDRAHVLAAVGAEWRRYDVRGTGRLGPLEFATWVMRANGAAVAPAGVKGAPGVRPVSAMNATARAFARADANHDGGVTPAEMTDFLMR